MKKPTILVLFNSSTYALRPWTQDGRFEVVTVDWHDTDHASTDRGAQDPLARYLSMDLSQDGAVGLLRCWLGGLGLAQPSFVLSFAPCTDLAVTGAKHFASKLERDPECQTRAVRDAQIAAWFGCPYIVENPVSVLATMWRKPDVYCHPYEFSLHIPPSEWEHPEFPGVIPAGDRYYKKTCLWMGNGAMPPETLHILPAPSDKDNPGWAKLGGKSARTKHIRSLTPRGLAWAIYRANRETVIEFTEKQ